MNDSHTDTLIIVVFALFVLFIYEHLIGDAEEMQQEFQSKRGSLRKQLTVAGITTHLPTF